jgi:hypothetical protein
VGDTSAALYLGLLSLCGNTQKCQKRYVVAERHARALSRAFSLRATKPTIHGAIIFIFPNPKLRCIGANIAEHITLSLHIAIHTNDTTSWDILQGLFVNFI